MTRTRSPLRAIPAVLGIMALVLAALVASPLTRAQAATGTGHAAAKPRPAATAASSSLDVFVGYADNLRADPANFPTPWDGSPGVIFAGCHGGCSFDGGAVRFVNNSPAPVTLDSVRVRLSTCVFDLWPHGTVLPPGQQFIIAQTAGGASSGCDNTSGLFDTSDIGPNGASWSGNCGQSGVVPEVDASINGTAQVFTDTGKVINTGGVDLASCPAGTNESTQWTSVGSLPCPGATLVLAPPTQTLPIGSTATVKATLANTCGTGLQGAAISFAATSGPDAGLKGTATTDSDGVATFSYSGSTVGTDTLTAGTANPAGTITSNDVAVVWQKRQAHLAVSAGSTTGDFDDPATVSAALSDSGGPLAGRSVTFALNGAETCTATTDAAGIASCSLTPAEAAGTYPLTASFAGDATDTAASASAGFTVTLEETTLAYTGPTRAANGEPLTLSGVLKEDGDTPIATRTVTFTLGSGASAQVCSGVTDTAGNVSCTLANVDQPSPTTSVPVTAVFAGDSYYRPATATATLRFTYLTGRAYGLAAGGLVTVSPTPDTGPVSTATAGTHAPPCVATLSGLISAHTLCASVVTALDPATSTATASVQDATVGIVGIPVIKVGLVQASSQTRCTGSTGAVTVTSITVGGVAVNLNIHPAPNTVISVLGVTLVLNEQLPVAGADQGLEVNAVHIKASPLGLGLLDVKIGSATSDIHNC
ncbi:choice-of-anchor P family protein [Streptomyces sp. HPF1205]|uniref:choice-of-anchor P family protein n=1 Tax=Streptomyces sp. HPF1205 TaxID=2873262 RepID=UPI001CED1798|nr:choice-of-anchor P family protein [Streptomyces sp. HPF1205]